MKTLDDYFKERMTVSHKVCMYLVNKEHGATLDEISEAIKCRRHSVQSAIYKIKQNKVLYVYRYQQMLNHKIAWYKLGDMKDASKVTNFVKMSKVDLLTQAEQKLKDMNAWCVRFAKVLVPQRNEAERRAVNQQYLDWIRA